MHEGVDGRLRDKTRPPGKSPLPAETVKRVVDLTLAPPPSGRTQRKSEALCLESRPVKRPCRHRTREAGVRVGPIAGAAKARSEKKDPTVFFLI